MIYMKYIIVKKCVLTLLLITVAYYLKDDVGVGGESLEGVEGRI